MKTFCQGFSIGEYNNVDGKMVVQVRQEPHEVLHGFITIAAVCYVPPIGAMGDGSLSTIGPRPYAMIFSPDGAFSCRIYTGARPCARL